MVKKIYKPIVRIFVIALMVNAIAPLYYSPISNQKKEIIYKELSKLLGETVIICTNSNSQKYYISTFERQDKERSEHLKKLDFKKNSSGFAFNDQADTTSQFYISLNLKKLDNLVFEEDIISAQDFVIHKASRAPPVIS